MYLGVSIAVDYIKEDTGCHLESRVPSCPPTISKLPCEVLSLACLAAPVLHFLGKLSLEGNKRLFLAASVGWFVLAPLWSRRR
jgi:hypothetical protein